ncbi:streptogrisin C [Allocatelliglobosispora scoriae]|uniref:Streptogrisin C n=1 Tax=Allocatelliglobosispora scoriae TaxID=643052 RepID=A0A841BZ86_9ACTN|nr:carbohydrate-binding protein [Allocatelliglobosispora scoriae]MBB5872030.1 streptogrisin C [Allocatelliglobosispora scoriae]
MSRRTLLAAATGTAAAGLVAILTITPNAAAGTVPAAAPAAVITGGSSYPADLLAAVSRDLRLTPAQATARLDADYRATRTEGALRQAIGSGYGGAWVTTAGRLTVGVTSATAAKLAQQAGADTKLVARSEAQLAMIQSTLDSRAAKAPKAVTGWHVDLTTNTVVVRVRAGGEAAAREFARGVDTAAVRFEATTEQPRPTIDVIGGNAYYIGSGTRCSVGFSVTGGFVTAGHCGTTGASTTQPSGSFGGSSFPGNDYAWVRVAAGNTPRSLVNGYGNANVTIAGSQEAAVGATVCRSGSTTGWHCGTISARNSSVTYPQGTVSGLIRTNVCSEPGDSGGSLVAGSQAQGVTSGGSGNCSSGGTTYFQPVGEILQAFGLTLVTNGTPPQSPQPTASTSNPPGGTTWAAYTAYAAGATVTYAGLRYQCRIAHTSLPGWEPPNVPALWQRI